VSRATVDWIIKLGGRGLIDPATLALVADQIAQIRQLGIKVAVVHGGGPAINEELTRRGISWDFIDGQRVTTPEMMDVIEMVLCGSMNRKVVRALEAAGVEAVGFSGVDGGTLQCSQLNERLQQVGSVEFVDSRWLESIVDAGGVPCIAPIGGGVNSRGIAFNINADWAAAQVAAALKGSTLVFLTDQDGILGANDAVIPTLSESGLEALIMGEVVKGGMLTKARAILHALRAGVSDVRVLNAKNGLWAEGGTACRLQFSATENHTAEVTSWL
jgi:acetylglutamate kinase